MHKAIFCLLPSAVWAIHVASSPGGIAQINYCIQLHKINLNWIGWVAGRLVFLSVSTKLIPGEEGKSLHINEILLLSKPADKWYHLLEKNSQCPRHSPHPLTRIAILHSLCTGFHIRGGCWVGVQWEAVTLLQWWKVLDDWLNTLNLVLQVAKQPTFSGNRSFLGFSLWPPSVFSTLAAHQNPLGSFHSLVIPKHGQVETSGLN